MVIIHCVCRAVLVVAGKHYLLLAVCLNYTLVAIGIVNSVVSVYYPRVSARRVLLARLVHVLPEWLVGCSGPRHHAASGAGDASNRAALDPLAGLFARVTSISINARGKASSDILSRLPGAARLNALVYEGCGVA